MKDFPAAHSMDSTWFAVDEDGNLAVFDTGEDGCMPKGDFPCGGEAAGGSPYPMEEDTLLARVLFARAEEDPRLKALLPPTLSSLESAILESEDWRLIPRLLRAFGVWTYDGQEVSGLYVREGGVGQSIRLDELDETTRRAFRGAGLPVRFRDAELVSPGEHVSVFGWNPYWYDRQGRPHPTSGQENEFQSILEHLPVGEQALTAARAEAPEGKALEGEAVYRAVERMIGDPTRDFSARPFSEGCLAGLWGLLKLMLSRGRAV